jgi:phosphatidylglycerophosphatase A
LLALQRALATVGGAGYVPVAPGTAGTAVAAIACFFWGGRLDAVGWAVLLLVVSAVGVWSAQAVTAGWGKDPSRVVIDEAAGYLFTVAWLPPDATVAVAGFVLFRVLDIFKPPPVRQCERLPGGWGIMADDIAAGIIGQLLLRLGQIWFGAA